MQWPLVTPRGSTFIVLLQPAMTETLLTLKCAQTDLARQTNGISTCRALPTSLLGSRMEDSRGKIRGACNVCGCTQYSPSGDGIWKCRSCGHPPAKHQMLGARRTCRYPGCYASLDFDMNTGEEKPWCRDHRGYNGPDVTMQVQDVEYYDDCSYGVVDDSGGGGQPPSWGYQHTTGS